MHSQSQLIRKSHSAFKTDVYLTQEKKRQLIIKDFSASPWLLRHTICQFLLSREIKMQQRLKGVSGIPEFLKVVGKHAFAMAYVHGESPTCEQIGRSDHLLQQLDTCITQMHQRGVCHNDIRVDNMMLTEKGKLYLIDYGAAFAKPNANWLINLPLFWLFNFLCSTDRSKVARIKQRIRPNELTPDELALIKKTGFARRITKSWKRLVLPIISPATHRNKNNRK